MSVNESAGEPASGKASSLTVYDRVSLSFCVLCVTWAVMIVFFFQPDFRSTFTEFGSEVPPFTALCLRPWFPVVLALIPILVTVGSIAGHATQRARAVLMTVTIFLSLAFPGLLVVGLCLPL